MKKKLLFVVVTVLALISCSSDETIAVKQDSPINFRAYTTGLTRAADASLTAGSSFKVTAYETGGTSTSYFTNVVFTGATTSTITTFSSSNKYYWPVATKKLDFYAWSPSTYAATTDDYTGFSITPGTTIASQPDFIYAVSKGWNKDGTNGGRNGSPGVSLNFRHAESKIIINLKNTNANLKITVDKVRIGNLRGTETFTWNQCTDGASSPTIADHTDVQNAKYLDGNWTANSSQTSVYEVTVDASTSYNEFDGVTTARGLKATASDYEMILIPQELSALTQYDATDNDFKGAFISVDLKIENKAEPGAYLAGSSSDFITAMWPLASITWLPGHKYTYIVDLAGGGYYPTDQTQPTPDNVLDPIIDSGAEIKFLNPTIDTWITDLDGNTVADDDIDVTM